MVTTPEQLDPRPTRHRVGRLGVLIAGCLGVLLSLVVLATSAQYFRFDPSTFFTPQRLTYLRHEGVLYLHISGAMVALGVLLAQVLVGQTLVGRSGRSGPGRGRYPSRPGVHRVLGRLYAGGVAAGGFGGLALSFVAHGGLFARIGFFLLAVAWPATTALGVRAARRHELQAHRRWIVRSAALTFAAVTLRLYLGVFVGLHGGVTTDQAFSDAYAVIAWACWVPNLAIAWWLTRRRDATEHGSGRPWTDRPAADRRAAALGTAAGN